MRGVDQSRSRVAHHASFQPITPSASIEPLRRVSSLYCTMDSGSATASHKRNHSSTALDAQPPRTKQRTEASPNALPEYVYVVVLELSPQYSPPGSEVRGVFCSIEDANNAVRGIVDDEYTSAEQCQKGTRSDGRVYWKSYDIGEGDAAEIQIEKQKVHHAGSYPAREWPAEMEWEEHSDLGSGEKEGSAVEFDEEEEGEEEEDEEEEEEEGEGEEDEEDGDEE